MNLEPQSLKTAIKALMKRSKKNYYDLASHLGVSHATIKRILTSEELSLSRLLAICDWLSVSISDLEQAALDISKQNEPTFTEDQELFLSSDIRFVAYLIQLYGGASPNAIAKKFSLNEQSSNKYLLRLEQYDLIKVTDKGQVTPVFKSMPSWISGGPLARAHYELVISTFSEFFIASARARFKNEDNPKDSRVWGNLDCRPMSKKNFESMMEELEETITRWDKMGSLEEKLEGADNLGRAVKMTCLSWKSDPGEAKTLENVFGEVENL